MKEAKKATEKVKTLKNTNKDKKEGESKRMKINKEEQKKQRNTKKLKKESKGITLIALVVTIVVLLILAAVSISAVFGDNGLIVKAQLSAFATEMQNIKENVGLKQAQNAFGIAQGTMDDLFTDLLNENSHDIQDTLKREILYTRDGRPEDKTPNDYDVEEFNDLLDSEGNVEGIYIVDKKTGNGKEDTYVYDEETDTVFKIPPTRIGKQVYHSYECAVSEKGGTGEETSKAIEQESEVVQVGEERYYAPNLKGFSGTETYVVYYSEDTTETKEDITAQEYIENGEKYEITEGGKTYTFHDYSKAMWANIKTIGFGQEAWWVWVPRYAYKINGTTNTDAPIDIIYIDIDNKPLNPKYNGELPKDENGQNLYEVHPAFNTKDGKLKGIWVSKYEPTYAQMITSDKILAPDLSGFDPQTTYIELFDKEVDSFKENPKTIANTNLNKVNENKEWYDYENNIWANIRTNANEQEAWWVWIPRYAYRIVENRPLGKEIEIIYVGLNDKPLDTKKYGRELPEGFIVHPAFNTVDGNLKGIWVSKYEPTKK